MQKYEYGIKEKIKFYSYKLQQSGLRTQVVMDISRFILYISPSLSAKNNPDQVMFKRDKIYKIIEKTDCMYTIVSLDDWLEEDNTKGGFLKTCNFKFPIRKIKKKEFTLAEKKFNKKFSSMRSAIEKKFGEFGIFFRRLHPDKNLRFDDKTFNLQFKFCALMLNFWEMAAHIKEKPLYLNWYKEDFDFGMEIEMIEPESWRRNTIRE